MIVSSPHLIGGDADVTVSVGIGAARVTDVVDAALVVCISGHFGSAFNRDFHHCRESK